jgi:hypothetical protein
MLGHDTSDPSDTSNRSNRSTAMSEHSRRDFLRGVGVTAAAATVAVIVPTGIATAGEHDASERDDGSATPEGPVVVYVKDPRAGTVAVMKGENETLVTDKVLARKLARMADLAQ